MRISFVTAALVAAVVSSATRGLPSPSLTSTDFAESLLVAVGSDWVGAADVPPDFKLSLARDYGLILRFSRCRLDVVVYDKQALADLWCQRQAGGLELLAREKLSSQETQRLIDLFERAALYQGGYIGSDTSADGIFETLKVHSWRSGTVVLVTTGNTTFKSDSARKELLSQLRNVEKRLSSTERKTIGR